MTKDFSMSNTIRQKQNGCDFADDIFEYIFPPQNVIFILLNFVLEGHMDNK